MSEIPFGDPDVFDHWSYRLLRFEDDSVLLVEVYYADEEQSTIVGWANVSMSGDSPAELGYAVMQMVECCTDAMWHPHLVLSVSDLPESDPGTIFELEDSDYN